MIPYWQSISHADEQTELLISLWDTSRAKVSITRRHYAVLPKKYKLHSPCNQYQRNSVNMPTNSSIHSTHDRYKANGQKNTFWIHISFGWLIKPITTSDSYWRELLHWILDSEIPHSVPLNKLYIVADYRSTNTVSILGRKKWYAVTISLSAHIPFGGEIRRGGSQWVILRWARSTKSWLCQWEVAVTK